LLILNLLILVSGNLLALITLSIQGAVLFGLLKKKEWIGKALFAWSSILIIAGSTSLLSVFLKYLDFKFFDDVTDFQEIIWFEVYFRSLFMVLGIFIIIQTKRTLTISTDSTIDKDAETSSA